MLISSNRSRLLIQAIVASSAFIALPSHADASKQSIAATCDISKNACEAHGTDEDGSPIANWMSWWTAATNQTASNQARMKPKRLKGAPSITDTVACEFDKGDGASWHVTALDSDAKPTTPWTVVTVHCAGFARK